MKYTFNIAAEHIPPKLVLTKAEGESEGHLMLKFLSYLLYYRPGIKVEYRIEQHFQPDLIVEGDNFQPLLWVDCGNTTLKKLDKVATKNHHCDIYIVKENEYQLRVYYQKAQKRVKHVERVEFICFDDTFVSVLVEGLQRTNEVRVNTLEPSKYLSLTFNDQIYESAIKSIPT